MRQSQGVVKEPHQGKQGSGEMKFFEAGHNCFTRGCEIICDSQDGLGLALMGPAVFRACQCPDAVARRIQAKHAYIAPVAVAASGWQQFITSSRSNVSAVVAQHLKDCPIFMAASSRSTATQVGESSCVVVVSIKHALSQKLDVLYATAFNAHFWHPIRSVINPNSNPLVMHLLLVEDVGQVATTTVLTVLHGSHEDTSAALLLSVFCHKRGCVGELTVSLGHSRRSRSILPSESTL